MKAIRIHKHGKSDVLAVDDLGNPKPQAGEVLIKVKAAALNHLDLFVRNGIPGVPLPLIMGSDAAGEVVETGENVTWLKKGDEVINVPFRINPDDDLKQAGQPALDANEYAESLKGSDGFKNPEGIKGGVSGICKAVYSGIRDQKI